MNETSIIEIGGGDAEVDFNRPFTLYVFNPPTAGYYVFSLRDNVRTHSYVRRVNSEYYDKGKCRMYDLTDFLIGVYERFKDFKEAE